MLHFYTSNVTKLFHKKQQKKQLSPKKPPLFPYCYTTKDHLLQNRPFHQYVTYYALSVTAILFSTLYLYYLCSVN